MFFDRRCPICGSTAPTLCGRCWSGLDPAPTRWLASPEPGSDKDLEVRALLAYGPDTAAAILAAKNGGRRAILRQLGRQMAALVGESTVDVVTWVPASASNRRQRGFDQGRVLARSVAAQLNVPARAFLDHQHREPVRVGRAPVPAGQKGKGRAERQSGADLVATRSVGGRVVLVDDVITTGASLRHGADALYRAGAAHVVAVTAASADREK